jgi:hypothetical protein
LGEHGADVGRDHVGLGLGDLGQHVAQEVHPAALPGRALQHGGDRGLEPGVGVGDDQLDAVQAAGAQVAQELGPERFGLAVADGAAQDLAVAVRAHSGGDHHGLGHDPAVDSGLAVGGIGEHIRERLVVQWAGPPRGHLTVQLGADAGHLALGHPGAAHRDHQVVDPACGHPFDVGLHDHRVQGDVDASAGGQQGREERPGAGLGDLDRHIPHPRGQGLVAGAVALRRAGLRALMQTGADHRGRLRLDQLLQHRREQPAHQLTAIRGLHRLDQREQGRLIQGHRVFLSMSSLVGTHRDSRDGPSTSRTDTNRSPIRNPSYTTRGDATEVTARCDRSAHPTQRHLERFVDPTGPPRWKVPSHSD